MHLCTFTMIEGVIFDLDGTIIDSEPIWKEVEQKYLARHGLILSEEDCLATTGLPTIDTIKFWYDKLENPSMDPQNMANELKQNVINIMKEEGDLKPGIIENLEFWKSKGLPLGIASASSMPHIEAVVDRFKLDKYFSILYSADFELYGKPHPGVYISACKNLKIDPLKSVAFEDSFNGMLAAKSARMKVVGLLDAGQNGDTRYDFIDLKIKSHKEFDEEKCKLLESLMRN